MALPRTAVGFALSSFLAATAAQAQQFQEVPGLIPGTPRWSEGLECVDVDGDGDLDLLVADGGGFSSPGVQYPNLLFINQLVETGSLSFTDESAARLGTDLWHSKGVTTGDVDGDGWVDLLFTNAFNTDPPSLYINRGAAQPGFFDLESSTRGFTTVLSSAGAQFGDLDDDGDLDVILCDSGASYLGGTGGRPRLYFNDGTGVFSEDAVSLGASVKRAHMDVQLVDVDADWDLDFLGFNRASNPGGNHYLMLNDGAGTFSDASTTLPPTSSSVYEAEVGDFDGDLDIDIFYVSLSGFSEGHQENTLVPSGSLGFVNGPALPPGVDDNEIVLIDYDVDGDLDVFVGSLGSRERLYRNDGGLVFVQDSAQIQAIADSTLDATAADLDNDGDYDLITVQGESNSAQWGTKVYLNTGPPDTLPPVFVRGDGAPTVSAWPWVAHIEARDQAVDDGVNYMSARAAFAPVPDYFHGVQHAGGAFDPPILNVAVGDSVVFTNADPTQQSITSTTQPYPYDYNLSPMQMVQHVFISPGTYTYESTFSGATGTVVVSGTAQSVDATYSGGGIFRFEIPQQPGLFAVELFVEDWAGNVRATNSKPIVPDTVPGTNYCGPAAQNSSGASASLLAQGSIEAAANFFVLRAYDLPVTGQFGYFLVSRTQGLFTPPGSQGPICLGGNIGRFNDVVLNSGNLGQFSRPLDLTFIPVNPPVPVLPGETWNFQAWFRDQNPTSTTNFTDGLSVTFQ